MKKYQRSNIPLAKALRRNMTPWERKLWYDFLRSYPVRFQRQKCIGSYIVDFYCAKVGLAIELDGGGHYEATQAQQDCLRDLALAKMGVSVFRICNTDVEHNFAGVCQAIDLRVKGVYPASL